MFLCIFHSIVCWFAAEDPLRKRSKEVWESPVLQHHGANKQHRQCSDAMILEQSQGSDKNATEMMFGQAPRSSPSAASSALWKPLSVASAVPFRRPPLPAHSSPVLRSPAGLGPRHSPTDPALPERPLASSRHPFRDPI